MPCIKQTTFPVTCDSHPSSKHGPKPRTELPRHVHHFCARLELAAVFLPLGLATLACSGETAFEQLASAFAMNRLSGRDHCVNCHAMPRKSGSLPQSSRSTNQHQATVISRLASSSQDRLRTTIWLHLGSSRKLSAAPITSITSMAPSCRREDHAPLGVPRNPASSCSSVGRLASS